MILGCWILVASVGVVSSEASERESSAAAASMSGWLVPEFNDDKNNSHEKSPSPPPREGLSMPVNERLGEWLLPEYRDSEAGGSDASKMRFRAKYPGVPKDSVPTGTNTYGFKSQIWGPYEQIQNTVPLSPGGTSHLAYHNVHSLTGPGSPQYFVRDLYKLPTTIYDAQNPMPAAVLPQSRSIFMVPHPEVPYLPAAPPQPIPPPFLKYLQDSQLNYRKERLKMVQEYHDRPSAKYSWSMSRGSAIQADRAQDSV